MLRHILALVLFVALTSAKPPVSRSRVDIENFKNYLESTVTGNGVKLSLNPESDDNAEENSGRFQGDIVLDQDEIDSMVQAYAMGRNALITEGSRWPDNTVPVEIADGFFSLIQIRAIWIGLREIEENTCIRFVERRPHHQNYVTITGYGDGCYANVGYRETRGYHILNLTPNEIGVSCFRHGTIVHEMLHILGFYHMHSTPERDEYVEIKWENIRPGTEHNFFSYTTDVVHNLGVEYDYVSCMHYGPYSGSVNGEIVILALQEYEGTMGQRVYITDKDWLRVNRHYNCPMNWS